MEPGDLVEFLSGDGRWKPAVIVHVGPGPDIGRGLVRMRTGPGVHIVRRVKRNQVILVRLRSEQSGT